MPTGRSLRNITTSPVSTDNILTPSNMLNWDELKAKIEEGVAAAFGVDRKELGLDNTIEINIDVNSPNFVYASPFAKVVTGLDVSMRDGRGVEGIFLPRYFHNEDGKDTRGSKFRHIEPITLGVPLLVGFKFGYGTGKHAATSRFAQLFTVSDSKISIESEINPGMLQSETVEVTGNLKVVAGATDGAYVVDNFTPANNAYGDIFVSVDMSSFDSSMKEYLRTHKDVTNRVWQQAGNPPPATAEDLLKYGERSLRYKGKRFNLPEGTVIHKMEGSDIYLVVYLDSKGNKRVSTLDALANYANNLDENMISFMEDQAKQLEALAYAYRIVAAAARKDN